MHIARDAPRRADAFVDRLYEKMVGLVDMPGLGVARDDLQPGLRALIFRDYVIFYMTKAQGLVIVRVLHGSRNIEPNFRP